MAYKADLAERIRTYLSDISGIKLEEKKMFGGLCFMVNGKMCVCASDEGLMCRYDPLKEAEVIVRKGFQPMVMKGSVYKGYCYVMPAG